MRLVSRLLLTTRPSFARGDVRCHVFRMQVNVALLDQTSLLFVENHGAFSISDGGKEGLHAFIEKLANVVLEVLIARGTYSMFRRPAAKTGQLFMYHTAVSKYTNATALSIRVLRHVPDGPVSAMSCVSLPVTRWLNLSISPEVFFGKSSPTSALLTYTLPFGLIHV